MKTIFYTGVVFYGFLGGSAVKNLPAMQRPRFSPWVGKVPWRRNWLPAPVFLPGESHGQRSLAGYSPWCCRESDMTEWLNTNKNTQSLSEADEPNLKFGSRSRLMEAICAHT